jgi:hypothetical protein
MSHSIEQYKNGIQIVTPENDLADGGALLNDNFKQIADLISTVPCNSEYTVTISGNAYAGDYLCSRVDVAYVGTLGGNTCYLARGIDGVWNTTITDSNQDPVFQANNSTLSVCPPLGSYTLVDGSGSAVVATETSGSSGFSGYSGLSGKSGYSGISGRSGDNGCCSTYTATISGATSDTDCNGTWILDTLTESVIGGTAPAVSTYDTVQFQRDSTTGKWFLNIVTPSTEYNFYAVSASNCPPKTGWTEENASDDPTITFDNCYDGSSGFSGYSGVNGCPSTYTVTLTFAAPIDANPNGTYALTRQASGSWQYSNPSFANPNQLITLSVSGGTWTLSYYDDGVNSATWTATATNNQCPPLSGWSVAGNATLVAISNSYSVSGYSGASGYSGRSGTSGYSGRSGYSGSSGYSGVSGYSGISGRSGYSGATPTAPLTLTGSSDVVQLTVKGNATQTSNIQSWTNSSSTVLGAVGGDGAFRLKTAVWHIDTDSNSRLYFGSSSTTYLRGYGSGAVFLVRNASDSDIYQVNNDGTMIVFNSTASTGVSKFVVKAGAGQSTTNLQEWQNNSGTALVSITATGEIDMGTAITAQKFWLYKSGTTRYGMGIQSGELDFFAPTGGKIVFGQMSTSDGTTQTQFCCFDMGNKRFGVGTLTPTCAASLIDLNNNATTTVGSGGMVEIMNLGRGVSGGNSWPQVASFFVGRYKTATTFSPETRLELKLKNASDGTLAGDTTAGVWTSDGRSITVVPNSAIADATLGASQMSFYLNEGTNTLTCKVKYADGTTVKTGTMALS